MSEKLNDYKELITKLFGKNNNIIIENPSKISIEKFSTGSYLLNNDFCGIVSN